MSKFDAVWKWIAEHEPENGILTFQQIEDITGIPIDHSFLKYKTELLEYGYRVGKISLKNKTVSFEKVNRT